MRYSAAALGQLARPLPAAGMSVASALPVEANGPPPHTHTPAPPVCCLQPRIRAPQAWAFVTNASPVLHCTVDTGVKVRSACWPRPACWRSPGHARQARLPRRPPAGRLTRCSCACARPKRRRQSPRFLYRANHRLQWDHPDLAPNLLPMGDYYKNNNYDDNGHGSHVAGIMGAVSRAAGPRLGCRGGRRGLGRWAAGRSLTWQAGAGWVAFVLLRERCCGEWGAERAAALWLPAKQACLTACMPAHHLQALHWLGRSLFRQFLQRRLQPSLLAIPKSNL